MNEFLNKLLALQKNKNSNEICLTIYHPVENTSKDIVKTEVRNLTMKYLKECSEDIDNKIIRSVADKIGELIVFENIYKSGIGIFVKFNKSDFKSEELVSGENIYFLFSKFIFPDSGFCGEIFDITYVNEMTRANLKSMIINISWKSSEVYEYINEELHEVMKIDNKILEAMEDRYTNVQSTATGMGSGGIMHSGSQAHEKDNKFTRTIINNLLEKLKEMCEKSDEYRYILCFYSADFSVHKEHLHTEIKKLCSKDAFSEQKNLDSVQDLKRDIEEVIKKLTITQSTEELEKARNDLKKNFIEDWENVSKAANNAQIQKVFIKIGSYEPGFIIDEDFVSVVEEEGSVKQGNIAPWIIKKVIETGGDVALLDKDSNLIKYPIAAVLRFSMTEAV